MGKRQGRATIFDVDRRLIALVYEISAFRRCGYRAIAGPESKTCSAKRESGAVIGAGRQVDGSDAIISDDMATTSWAEANGFESIVLPGTPCEVHW